MAKSNLQVGDKVAYSVQWLKSVGLSHSETARDRGIITEIKKFGTLELATIKWDGDSPEKVAVPNLAKVGANSKFCNC